MIPIGTLSQLAGRIEQLETSSKEMKDYLNSLNMEEYASLATAFVLGRDGWERNYYDTNEYHAFVEEKEAHDEEVTQEILDNKFLSHEKKLQDINTAYAYEKSSSLKIDGVYSNNWLGQKTNIITAVKKGIGMLSETAY